MGDIDLDDLFGDVLRRRRGPVRGADQEAELELTVEDAFQGGRRRITLPGPGGSRSYDVTIPAGVTDGQRIRLAGQGGRGATAKPGTFTWSYASPPTAASASITVISMWISP